MWIDIVVVVLLLAFTIIGLIKGFFNSLLALISSAGALALAIWLGKPAAAFINKIVNVPAWFEKILKKESYTLFGSSTLSFTKQELAAFLSVVVAVIVVFILIKLAVWLLAKLFDSAVSKSTVLSGLNKILGAVFGFIKGGFIVLVLLVLCSILSGTEVFGNKIQTQVDKTLVTKYLYKYVDDWTEKTLNDFDMKEFVKDLVKDSNKKDTGTDSGAGSVSQPRQITVTFGEQKIVYNQTE